MKHDFLELRNLVKTFGSGSDLVAAVDRISLLVGEGELVTLLGPSGCGKTTTLRMIAGFEIPNSGEILIDGERINEMPANKRPTTMVFQNYALFPHMTVFENISYGLKVRGDKQKVIGEKVARIMNLVGLKGMADRSPEQLSGGQQQRVSLARSLVMEPKVLLLDEPLSNLDAKLRVSTRIEIRKLQQRVGITSVYVTHDQEEAMTLSDRVVIMHEGRIQQVGPPREIYAHPASRFVADFIGQANFLECEVSSVVSGSEVEVEVLGFSIRVPSLERSFAGGERVLLVLRPESVELLPPKTGLPAGTVRESVYLGSQMVYEVEVGKKLIAVEVGSPQEHKVFKRGEEAGLKLKEKSLHILKKE